MKVYALFFLFSLAAVNGEKKINLEDIERDNLKTENKPKLERIQQTDETKYSQKDETNQEQLAVSGSNRYGITNGEPSTYVTPPLQNVIPEEYDYRAQNVLLSQEKNPPAQIYEHSQTFYQPQVPVGKQIQSFQQGALAEKYLNDQNKETLYVDIPMSQLLSYYPNVDFFSLGGTKSQPVLQELVPQATHQISIPFYASLLGQKQFLTPFKTAYQILPQYLMAQPVSVAPTRLSKPTKNAVYTTPISLKKQVTSSLLTSPVYVQPDRPHAQEKKLLYTQAIIGQPQSRYVPRLIFNEPSSVYAQENNQRLQENQLYLQSTPLQQSSNQVFHEHENRFAKAPEAPRNDFVPPQAEAQNFKGDVTEYTGIPSEEEEPSAAKSQYLINSEPRSLLDTYVPSNLIVARDSARYQEKPLRLENGFLPSKVNFVHQKKRKTE